MQLSGCLHLLNFSKASWEDPTFKGFSSINISEFVWLSFRPKETPSWKHTTAAKCICEALYFEFLCNSSSHAVQSRFSWHVSLILNIFSFAPCIQLWNFPSEKNASQIAKVNLKPCTETDGRKGRQSCEIKFHAKTKSAVEKNSKTSHNKKFCCLSHSLTCFERRKKWD